MASLLLRATGMSNSTHLVTLSTHRRRFVLRGDGHAIATDVLKQLPQRCPGAAVDCAVLMPDRIYAIVRLCDAGTLSSLVQAFKTATSRAMRARTGAGPVWEKGYAHRVIRDEAELISVRAMLKTYDARGGL